MQNCEIFSIVFEPLTQFISSVFVALISIYVVSKTTKLNTKRNLLSEVYTPIFNFIEPHIYSELSVQTASELINEIETITKKASYIPPEIALPLESLRESIQKNSFNKESYIQLCKHVDSKYDKLCRSLGYSVRTLSYRLQKKQFPTKISFCYAFFKYITANVLLFAGIFLFTLLLMAWVLIFFKTFASTIFQSTTLLPKT